MYPPLRDFAFCVEQLCRASVNCIMKFDIILNAFCAHLRIPELLEIIEFLCCIVHVQVRKYNDQS